MNSVSENIENAFFKKRDQDLIERLKHRQAISINKAIKSLEAMILHNQDDGNTKEALKVIKAELLK
jgi:hypothetical protein